MKKTFVMTTLVILLLGFTLAIADNSKGNYENGEIVGASCGTVSPGYENECCLNKGYEGWDDEEFECIGEQEQNREQNMVGATNKYQKSNLTQTQVQNIMKEKNRLRIRSQNSSECPNDCTCSGSTTKCTFENGTRSMNVYAGNSGNTIIQVKNTNMSTNVELYKSEDGKVYGTFKGNKTLEVMMPDEIKERIQNKTRARIQNQIMNLTEDGYHIQAQKRARFLFMFPINENIEFDINPETGEMIKTKASWWGFLARDMKVDSE